MTDAARPARSTGRPPALLVLFVAGLTGLRLFVAARAGLIDDEAYYRLWSLHLAPGYLDHAPMVAWMIAAGRALVGDDPLGVRLFAPLATFAGTLLLWRTVALVEGRDTATRAAVWFNAMILIGAGSVLTTPDGPSVFFWGATLWALAERVVSRDPRWWWVVGLLAGFGLLSKYSVLFLGLGIGVWLMSTRETRRFFLDARLWAAAVLAAAMFAPVVWWNAEHQWVSFAKQFGRTAVHEWRPEKLGELIGVQLLLIGLPMVPFVGLGLRRAFARRDALALLPVLTGLPFVAYLLFHSLHAGVEGNWPAPLYPSFAWLAAIGAADLGSLGDRWETRFARLRRFVAPVGFGLVGLVYLHVLVPLVVLPPSRDPTAQMKGWVAFDRELAALGDRVGAHVYGGRNYTLSAQLAVGLGAADVAPFDERERYIDLPVLDPRRVCGPILYVEREGRDSTAELSAHWRSITPLGTLARRAGDAVVEAHPVWRLADPVDCDPAVTSPRPD